MKLISSISEILKKIGGVCLAGMMFVTCADVTGRFFGYPILGSVEIVSILATFAIGMGLAFTHETDGHVGVEIVVRLLPEKTQTIVSVCTNFLSICLFAILTWRMLVYAGTMRKAGETTMNLRLPEYLVVYVMSFGLGIFTLMIIKDMIININKLRSK